MCPILDKQEGNETGGLPDIISAKAVRQPYDEERAIIETALEAQRDTFFVLEIATGRAVKWNRAFREISGYSDEEIASLKAPESYYSREDIEKARIGVQSVLAHESATVELTLITKDGKHIPTEYQASPILDEDGNPRYLIAIGRDMTERHTAEAALKESEERYRLLIENIPSVAWVTDEDVHTSYISPNIKKIFGFTVEEILEGGKGLWVDRIHAEDREMVLNAFHRLLTTDAPFEVEYRIQNRDGKWIWLYDRADTVKQIEGKKYVFGVFSDITAQKTAELEKKQLEEKLRHSEKMEAVGQLAGGVAHDFNNQLGGILGFAEMLKIIVIDHPVATGYVNHIIRASERSAELTAKLLAFARKGKYMEAPVDIHYVIRDVVTILKHSADKRIAIRTNLAAKSSLTIGETSQLQSALLNIGINACHAMPDGGELTFNTSITTLNDEYCRISTFDLVPGDYLEVTISDTGTGMPKKVKDRIFEPFFTTKEMGRGTGMGLSAVYGTITNHEGSIEVESTVGKGSTFRLQLPLSDSAMRAPVTSTPPSAVASASGKILVIDDEPLIRDTASIMLGSLGYDVLLAENGVEAVSIFKKQRDRIALVILDVVMPKWGGLRTFEALSEIDPTVTILVSTGYSIDGEARNILERGAVGILNKPFRRHELARQVSKAMTQSVQK